MFIDVSKARLPKGLSYLWIPQLVVRPSCRKDAVLLDCFFSSTLHKGVLMLLLARSLDGGPRVTLSDPVGSPILSSGSCNPLYYHSVLSEVDELLRRGDIDGLVLKPQDRRSRNLVIEVFKTILRLLCFPDPPQDFSQVYVLIGLDVQRKRAYFILGNEVLRSTVLEEVVYGHLNGLEALSPYL